MIECSVLFKEIEALPPVYQHEVADFVAYIKQKKLRKTASWEQAAEMAAGEYRTDKELTAFSLLDGEDFYETR